MLTNTKIDCITWYSFPGESIKKSALVHVWCCDLDDPNWKLCCDDSVLSPKEWQHAQRLCSKLLQRLFIQRRTLRRLLIGQFLGVKPQSLRFVETGFGKPLLVEAGVNRCEFSTSHSDSIFMMAISNKVAAVGVDVEVSHPESDWEPVAAMYMDPRRHEQFKNLPKSERQNLFLRFWTLHEASTKAIGTGIACKTNNSISPEQVWDLIFESGNPPTAWLPQGWKWDQRIDQVRSRTIIASTVLYQSMRA